MQHRLQNSHPKNRQKGKAAKLIQPTLIEESGRTAIIKRKQVVGHIFCDELTPNRAFEITSKRENQLILLFIAAVLVSLFSFIAVLLIPNDTPPTEKQRNHRPRPASAPITGMLVEIPKPGGTSQKPDLSIAGTHQVNDASDAKEQQASENSDPALDAKIQRVARLIKKQRYRRAIGVLGDWLDQHPDCAGFHFYYARALFLDNKQSAQKAREHVEKAIELNPFDAEFHNLLAILHQSLGQRLEATKSKKVYQFLRNNTLNPNQALPEPK